jgi:hypothetical protein
MSQVNVELGLSATATISLNDTAVRTLAGVPSGTIGMNNLQGKSSVFAFTISSNQTNLNLATAATAGGWNGSSKISVTVNAGVIISSNSTGTAAFTVGSSVPSGSELINNGTIVGMGGFGGGGSCAVTPGSPGEAGGVALTVQSPVSVTNNGTLAGGGGGGGSSGTQANTALTRCWFSGPGGGGRSSFAANSAGGVGCSFTGGAGTYSGAGAGNLSTAFGGGFSTRLVGGNGGDWGATGSAGQTGGTGGTFYANGAFGTGGAGGAGGAAVSGNSNVTWVATGTRFGALT